MPIDSYLNQTVTLKAKSSVDKFGKTVVATGVSIESRFQEKIKRLVDDNGKEYLADAELWVKPTQTINLDDLITVSSVNYKVVRIDTKRGLTGSIDHKKAYLKRTKE